MSSRLDRLFILLESGSSPGTRRAAAAQLGEVVAVRPGELLRLLTRLRRLLTNKEWDTRMAAAQALEAILAKVKVWQPVEEKVEEGECKDPPVSRLSLANFDLEKVMKTGKCLMASEGGEFDHEDTVGLGLQKQRLQQTLGLDVAQRLGFQQEGFIDDADLAPVVERAEERRQTASEVLAEEIAAITGQEVSAREFRVAFCNYCNAGELQREEQVEAESQIGGKNCSQGERRREGYRGKENQIGNCACVST